MVGRSGAHEAGRVSGRTSHLCRRALENIGPRTALPEKVLEGVLRPWWRGERRGEVRGGDWWRLFLGGLDLVSPGAWARWEGGDVERCDRKVLGKAVVPLALNGELPAVRVLDGAANREANREERRAGVMTAKARPRRAPASVTYMTAWRLWVRVTATEAWGPRRRPEMHTMLEAAGEVPTGEKEWTAKAAVGPAGRRVGALVGGGRPRVAGAARAWGMGGGGAVAKREGARGADTPRRNPSTSGVVCGGSAVLAKEMSSWNSAGVVRRPHKRAMPARKVSAELTCWRSW